MRNSFNMLDCDPLTVGDLGFFMWEGELGREFAC